MSGGAQASHASVTPSPPASDQAADRTGSEKAWMDPMSSGKLTLELFCSPHSRRKSSDGPHAKRRLAGTLAAAARGPSWIAGAKSKVCTASPEMTTWDSFPDADFRIGQTTPCKGS